MPADIKNGSFSLLWDCFMFLLWNGGLNSYIKWILVSILILKTLCKDWLLLVVLTVSGLIYPHSSEVVHLHWKWVWWILGAVVVSVVHTQAGVFFKAPYHVIPLLRDCKLRLFLTNLLREAHRSVAPHLSFLPQNLTTKQTGDIFGLSMWQY